MTDTLYSYLLQHRSLPIPGLGTILIERVPAQNDFVQRKLLPPTFHFRFDKYFDAPDKEFFTFLAMQENVADYEAIRQYNEWAFDLRNALRSENPVSLGALGQMSKDASGEIQFKPSHKVNALFSSVPANRVVSIHSERTETEIEKFNVQEGEETAAYSNEFPEEETIQENWKWYSIIFVSLILIILILHFFQKGWSMESTGLQPVW